MGVAFSAVMLFCVMMMADNWNYAWYMVVTKRRAMNVKPKLACGIEASLHVFRGADYLPATAF